MTQALRLVKRFRDWANLLRRFSLCRADSDSLGYVRAHEQKGAL
jgi:hypothetical protein